MSFSPLKDDNGVDSLDMRLCFLYNRLQEVQRNTLNTFDWIDKWCNWSQNLEMSLYNVTR